MRSPNANLSKPPEPLPEPKEPRESAIPPSMGRIVPNAITNSRIVEPNTILAEPSSFEHGGTVEKTGLALVHKGEEVKPMAEETVKLSKHRVVMHLAKGGLHRALHVDPNEKIPEDKLNAALHSTNAHIKKMAVLAKNMKGWHHGG